MINLKTYSNNWTNLRVEIKKLCEQLNVKSSELREVNMNHREGIEEKVWKTFSTRKNSRWIWESLKNSSYGFRIDFPQVRLTELIDKSEQVWFLLDESVNQKTKFWIYEGYIEPFSRVICKSAFSDEILIVSKKYKWLLAYNHHDILIGTGKMIDRLKEFEVSVKKAGDIE